MTDVVYNRSNIFTGFSTTKSRRMMTKGKELPEHRVGSQKHRGILSDLIKVQKKIRVEIGDTGYRTEISQSLLYNLSGRGNCY